MNEMPALLTQASRPSRSATSKATVAASAGELTFSTADSCPTPAAVGSAAATVARGVTVDVGDDRPANSRSASVIAMARPIPEPAPVTTTVLVICELVPIRRGSLVLVSAPTTSLAGLGVEDVDGAGSGRHVDRGALGDAGQSGRLHDAGEFGAAGVDGHDRPRPEQFDQLHPARRRPRRR